MLDFYLMRRKVPLDLSFQGNSVPKKGTVIYEIFFY
jgi:hypothetical protein